MDIIAIGRTKNLYNAIRSVVELGHNVTAIITAQAAPEYDVKEKDFSELAERIGCPFYDLSQQTFSIDEILASIGEADIGISVNWIRIFTQEVIDRFRIGILNAHFGDLPKHRGNACLNWAMIAGENEAVLSVHLVEGEKLDCGRIVCQDRMPLEEETTVGDVVNWSNKAAPQLFSSSIQLLAEDPEYTLKYAPCDDSEGYRCYPRTPDDSYIDWTSSAVEIDRLVKASSSPFRGAYTYISEDGALKRLYILKSKIVSHDTNHLGAPGRVLMNDKETGCTHVMCGRGVLEVSQCQIDDGKAFSPGRYFRSIRIKFGVRVEDYLWERMRDGDPVD